MDNTGAWVLAVSCIPAALGIYMLATNRLPRLIVGKRWIHRPRHYGVGQLLISLLLVLVALNAMLHWSHTFSRTLFLLALGCAVASVAFLFSALLPRAGSSAGPRGSGAGTT